MAEVWFWSDLHFLHVRCAELRGYATVEAHDQALIEAWLENVAPDDIVWLIGDLASSSPDRALEIIKKLPGHKHLIAGNHDKIHPMHRDSHKHFPKYLDVFESVQTMARRKIVGQSVLLSHFPYYADHTAEPRYRQYRLRNCGDWLIHGHIHSTQVMTSSREIHVGVDAWRSSPVHLDTITELITEQLTVEAGCVETP